MPSCWECDLPILPSEPRKSWFEEGHDKGFYEVYAHLDCRRCAVIELAERVLLPALARASGGKDFGGGRGTSALGLQNHPTSNLSPAEAPEEPALTRVAS